MESSSCATLQLLGISLVCYKPDEDKPSLCEDIFAPRDASPSAVVHLALVTTKASVSNDGHACQAPKTFWAQVLPVEPRARMEACRQGAMAVSRRRRVLWVFFDLESTGLDVHQDGIVQVLCLCLCLCPCVLLHALEARAPIWGLRRSKLSNVGR